MFGVCNTMLNIAGCVVILKGLSAMPLNVMGSASMSTKLTGFALLVSFRFFECK
jgi:hypothetical protein